MLYVFPAADVWAWEPFPLGTYHGACPEVPDDETAYVRNGQVFGALDDTPFARVEE